MTSPVALITGASSGIGLALTKHLLTKSWRVITCDINPPPSDLGLSTLFIKTDVSSWSSCAAAFYTGTTWSRGRLDLCALNAGIDDRDDIFASFTSDPSSPPAEPNMLTFGVNLYGPYYGCKLAAHYMALNSPPGGKIVITASSAGLYALPPIPQYTASKYALVGLTRALAPVADKVGVCVNAICPAIVATGLAPPGLMDAFEERVRTPMSTIMRAFDTLGVLDIEERDKDGEAGVDGLVGSDGLTGDRKPARNLNGMIVECSLDNLYFRNEVDKADDSQKFMAQSALDAWAAAYTERNKKFALQSQARQT
ncbi:hypothetical protein BDV97DRAFT_398664 [Delphinella strobiligena]|nr:hypothetical protein BDV97DRAFT_398664 [Delphinella strobiligena]